MTEPSAAPRQEFEEVVRPHLEYLWALSVRLTGNRTAAEDLLQDARTPCSGHSAALPGCVTVSGPGCG